MPGFGAGAIRDAEGNRYDLNSAADFYLRGFANIAYAGGQAVPEASDDDGANRRATLRRATAARPQTRGMAAGGAVDEPGRSLRARIEEAWNDRVNCARLRQAAAGLVRGSGQDAPLADRRALQRLPDLVPVRMADGRSMRELYDEDRWPMLMISFKSHLMSAYSIGADRLRQVHPHNPVYLHRDDAARLGIGHGDKVRLVTPGGAREGWRWCATG